MKATSTKVGLALAALLALGLGAYAQDKAVPGLDYIDWDTHTTMGLEEVEPGMLMYGITRQANNEMQVFGFKVVSIKYSVGFYGGPFIWGDIVQNDSIEFSGLQQGMSGSPVYYKDPGTGEDKIVGAVGVTLGWLKKARGGVTPIRDMLKVLEHNERKTNENYLEAEDFGWVEPSDLRAAAPRSLLQFTEELLGLETLLDIGLPAGHVPLLVEVSSSWAGFGEVDLTNATASGSSSSASKPKDFYKVVPGEAVGVMLVRGDKNIGGAGTATYVTKDGKVLAFGHPMMNAGKMSLPFYKGFVDDVMPLQMLSHKMSYLTHEIGSLVQDLQPAVLAEVGPEHVKQDNWIPVVVRFKSPYKETEFNYEIANYRRFLRFAAILLPSSIVTVNKGGYESAAQEVTATYRVRIHTDYKDEVIVLTNRAVGRLEDATWRAMGSFMNALFLIVENPYLEVNLKKVEHDLEVSNLIRRATIEGLFVDNSKDYKPGETIRVVVRMSPYKQTKYAKELSFTLPENMPSGRHVLYVSSAAGQVGHALANSEGGYSGSFENLMQLVRRQFEASTQELIAWMHVKSEGYVVGETEYKNLPYVQRQVLKNSLYTKKFATQGGYVFGDNSIALQDHIDGLVEVVISVKK